MVTSKSKYPTLERKPGKADNWIEREGGLPEYIDRIARALHYSEGMDISHAIATAVNTVKRWARKGKVVKWRDPQNNHVTTITAAQAAASVASWEAKKASARAKRGAKLSTPFNLEDAVDLKALAARAGQIEDPRRRAVARGRVLDLAIAAKNSADTGFATDIAAHHKKGLGIVAKHLAGMGHPSAISLASDHVSHVQSQIQRARWISEPGGVTDYTAEEQEVIDLALPPAFLKNAKRTASPKGKTPPAFLRKQKGAPAKQTGDELNPDDSKPPFPPKKKKRTKAKAPANLSKESSPVTSR